MGTKITLLFILFLPFHTFSQIEDIVNNISGPSVLLRNGSELIFSEFNGGRVSKINLDDPNPIKETLVTGIVRPMGLALKGDTLFIADNLGDKILIKKLSDPTSIFTEFAFVNNPGSIALRGDYLYISQWDFLSVSRINITESDPVPEIVEEGFFVPSALMISDNDLYVSEWASGKIYKLDLTEPNPEKILVVEGLESPQHLKLIDNHLYFTEFYPGKISKIDLAETDPKVIEVLTNLNEPTGMEFYDNSLIFGVYGDDKISKLPDLISSLYYTTEEDHAVVYPNPVSAYLFIKNLPQQESIIRIYDAKGSLILQERITKEGQINLKGLQSGSYYLSINNNKSVRKIIIIE